MDARGWVAKSPRLLLLVPALLFVGVVRHWEQLAPLTGDEPHYLIISDSVVRDGDLLVVNNYQEEAQRRAFFGPSDMHSLTFQYSVHNPGLSLVVAPFFKWGGAQGVKQAMAASCGLLAFLCFAVARRRFSEWGAVLTALAMTCAMPWLNGGGQIFPDMLSGLVVFTIGVLFALETAFTRRVGSVATMALIAFLPWIHLKQAAPMAVASVAWAVMTWRRAPAGTKARVLSLWPLLLPLASTIALLAYNLHAFNDLAGPYAPGSQTLEPQKFLMIFFALHFDQTQGLLLVHPYLWLGVFGLPLFVRERPGFAVFIGVLYVSLLLPNSMHTNWFGGLTFAGRFFWSSIALWFFPTFSALSWLWKRAPLSVAFAAAMSLQAQAWYATWWYDAPRRFYAWGFTTADKRGLIVDTFRFITPTFGAFETWLTSASFWIPFVLALAVCGLGEWCARRPSGADAALRD